jgi:hypothetical protein
MLPQPDVASGREREQKLLLILAAAVPGNAPDGVRNNVRQTDARLRGRFAPQACSSLKNYWALLASNQVPSHRWLSPIPSFFRLPPVPAAF